MLWKRYIYIYIIPPFKETAIFDIDLIDWSIFLELEIHPLGIPGSPTIFNHQSMTLQDGAAASGRTSGALKALLKFPEVDGSMVNGIKGLQLTTHLLFFNGG